MTDAHTTVTQGNLHHTISTLAVIASRFLSDNLDILLVQGAWMYRGKVTDHNIARQSGISLSERPKACKVMLNNIDFFCIQRVEVQAKNKGGLNFVFATAYLQGETFSLHGALHGALHGINNSCYCSSFVLFRYVFRLFFNVFIPPVRLAVYHVSLLIEQLLPISVVISQDFFPIFL